MNSFPPEMVMSSIEGFFQLGFDALFTVRDTVPVSTISDWKVWWSVTARLYKFYGWRKSRTRTRTRAFDNPCHVRIRVPMETIILLHTLGLFYGVALFTQLNQMQMFVNDLVHPKYFPDF